MRLQNQVPLRERARAIQIPERECARARAAHTRGNVRAQELKHERERARAITEPGTPEGTCARNTDTREGMCARDTQVETRAHVYIYLVVHSCE